MDFHSFSISSPPLDLAPIFYSIDKEAFNPKDYIAYIALLVGDI